jgi:hypothetical protein
VWRADLLKKTLNAFKTPQLKRKTPAVSLFLEVNGQTYLGDEVAAAGGDSGPVVSGRSGGQGAGNDAMGSQVEIPEPKCWRFAERGDCTTNPQSFRGFGRSRGH